MLTLIVLPLLVVSLGLLAIWCFTLSRKIIFSVAAVLWLLYGVYESMMYARILCSGECNIRVDLLLIYPILFIVTIAACVSAAKTLRARQ
jgi:hypothetical protein